MKDGHVLHRIILRVLKPLVHLLIKQEVAHGVFSEIARKAYVEVARDEFALPNRKNTISRMAVLTGLSRKEVVRLAEDKEASTQPKIHHNRAARVVAGWLNDSDFQTQDGQLQDLPLKGDISFATLVERYSGDITSGAILDELIRLGIVAKVDNHSLRLLKKGYIPDQDEIESLDVLSICARNLLDTGVFNINNTSEVARFQRQLTHRNVNADIANQFSQLCQQKSMALLLELDQWLKDNTPPNSDSTHTKGRVGLGIYHFEDDNHE